MPKEVHRKQNENMKSGPRTVTGTSPRNGPTKREKQDIRKGDPKFWKIAP